jgi:hypothetical protein
MCFSAHASFGTSIILSIIGVATLQQATQPKQYLFASIPFIFAIQQLAEGILWLGLEDLKYAYLQKIGMYTFLFFAQVIWPILVPIPIKLIIKNEKWFKIQNFLLGIGVLISLYLGYCLIKYHVDAQIIENHIAYKQDYPDTISRYGGILYLMATIGPTFFTKIDKMWLLGVAILLSYFLTVIFYKAYIVSVWCFFSAIISIAVLKIIYELNKDAIKIIHKKIEST